MTGFLVISAVIAVFSIFAALPGRDDDRARLAEARRKLKHSGRTFIKGSPEERRALMIMLEGGSLDQI